MTRPQSLWQLLTCLLEAMQQRPATQRRAAGQVVLERISSDAPLFHVIQRRAHGRGVGGRVDVSQVDVDTIVCPEERPDCELGDVGVLPLWPVALPCLSTQINHDGLRVRARQLVDYQCHLQDGPAELPVAALGQAGTPFALPFDRFESPCLSELGAPRAEQLLQLLQIGDRNGVHGDGRMLGDGRCRGTVRTWERCLAKRAESHITTDRSLAYALNECVSNP